MHILLWGDGDSRAIVLEQVRRVDKMEDGSFITYANGDNEQTSIDYDYVVSEIERSENTPRTVLIPFTYCLTNDTKLESVPETPGRLRMKPRARFGDKLFDTITSHVTSVRGHPRVLSVTHVNTEVCGLRACPGCVSVLVLVGW